MRHHHPPSSRKGQWLLALLVLRPGRDIDRTFLARTLRTRAREFGTVVPLTSDLIIHVVNVSSP